jgi:hypothetical protein
VFYISIFIEYHQWLQRRTESHRSTGDAKKLRMKKILVIYYSQTGQLTQIIDSILEPVRQDEDVAIVYEQLKPQQSYPFPWNTYQFCDVFPESVAGTACELQPLACSPDEDYDLVIIAYTVWYLAPSIPINSFLQSPEAKRIIKNRPVLTIIGCRNMWLLAQEKVKQHVKQAGGRLAGNIVLADRANNLVGVLTIAAWMLSGKKEKFLKIFPRPGVSDADIKAAARFGQPILAAISREEFLLDQKQLNARGAVEIKPALLLMENRISKVFKIWSGFIRQKGGPQDPKRRKRVRAFMVYLIVAVIILAPLAAVVAFFLQALKKDKLNAEVEYYSQNALRDT